MSEEIRKVMYCPHCGNKAPQRLVHSQHYFEKGWDLKRGTEDDHPWSSFVTVCETCGHLLVYDNPGDQFTEEEFHYCDLEYPKSGQLHSSVPTKIARVYEEAFRIKEVAPNAFAVQIRRALEAICEDREATGGNLQKKLDHLTQKGDIPQVLSEASDVLRLVGNIGAHGIDESVHPLQVIALDDFFRAIVEYVYVAPSKLEEFKERMQQFRSESGRGE